MIRFRSIPESIRPFFSLQRGKDNRNRRVLLVLDVYGRLRSTVRSVLKAGPSGTLFLNDGRPPVRTIPYTDPEFYRTHILEQLLPFWKRHAVDENYGGFVTHLDRRGRKTSDMLKSSAMQARMVYGFTIGYELSRNPDYLRLAQHGVRFLVERMWDSGAGGWYQDVSIDGNRRTTVKHLFDQAYVLLGLAEFYRRTRDRAALEYARKTCALLERHALDPLFAGYYESCHQDWRVRSSAKTICIQLDMLAGLISLFRATLEEDYVKRAIQQADIVTRMLDPKHGCLLETFTRDWMYDPATTRDRIQYGHHLKAAWLLLRMYQITGNQGYYATARQLLDFSLRHGWDKEHGGFYQRAFRSGVPDSLVKEWWPESEGLQALLLMYRISGETRYYEYFRQLALFTFTSFWDRRYGEWVLACYRNGAVRDSRKGCQWKAAYHNVQACYGIRKLLEDEDPQ